METCEHCHEVEKGAGHWCMPAHTFIGDATLGSLQFEMELGDPPLRELPDLCCGCVGNYCCEHGEAPCSTS